MSANAPKSALSLRNVSVMLGGRTIIADVALDVQRGEFVAVLGPNGAGKSTMMRAILGLTPLAGGEAAVLGLAPLEARRQVGYLPQRHGFERSVRIRAIDLVRLGLDGTRWGLPVAFTKRARARRRMELDRVNQTIELVGASAYATRPVGELSGGEQQRVLIAQALVNEPEILILDEPLDGLDLPNQAAVAALVSRICQASDVAALLVAHDVNPLLGYIDRVVYLAGGRAAAGAVEDVISASSLSRLYGAPIDVLRTRDGRLVVVGQPEAPHHHGHRHPHR